MGNYSVRDISLVKDMDRAKKDLEDIKAAQLYGTKQMVIQETAEGPVQSADYVFIGSYYYDFIYKKVEFYADHQLNPVGKLLLDFRYPNSTTPAPDGVITVMYYVPIIQPANSGKLVWKVDIRGGTADFWCIFKVVSSDTGRIVITGI